MSVKIQVPEGYIILDAGVEGPASKWRAKGEEAILLLETHIDEAVDAVPVYSLGNPEWELALELVKLTGGKIVSPRPRISPIPKDAIP